MNYRRLTPEEVLEILREWHRQYCAMDEGDPRVTLDFNTTVYEWWFIALMIDGPGWRGIGMRLDEFFGTSFSFGCWTDVLHPWKKKTLRGVCELLATQAEAPAIEPAVVLGRKCVTAGAFLTLKNILAEIGCDTRELAPSTALSDFFRGKRVDWLSELIKLAPGRLPAIKFDHPALDRINCVTALSFGALMFSFVLQCVIGETALICTAAAALLAIMSWLTSLAVVELPPKRVEFRDLHDFRDLCHVMVADAPPGSNASEK